MDRIARRAYDAAIDCAALCMIALGSPDRDEFRYHMREALREALQLRGGFHDNEQSIDEFEARNVLNDVVTRVMTIVASKWAPLLGTVSPAEIGDCPELGLSESLRAVLTRIDEMCLSED
jgi:hypothetical protein